MAICPATLKPCSDDICRGNHCLKLPSAPVLTRCNGCNQLVALDGSDNGACVCEPDYDDGKDDE